VQAEENTVEPIALYRCDDRIAQPLECRPLYFSARPRRRAENMLDLPAMGPAGIEAVIASSPIST
jgi:hypothetical protein